MSWNELLSWRYLTHIYGPRITNALESAFGAPVETGAAKWKSISPFQIHFVDRLTLVLDIWAGAWFWTRFFQKEHRVNCIAKPHLDVTLPTSEIQALVAMPVKQIKAGIVHWSLRFFMSAWSNELALLLWLRSILMELGREGADLSVKMEAFQILINSCK
jgi:hypothetical protein